MRDPTPARRGRWALVATLASAVALGACSLVYDADEFVTASDGEILDVAGDYTVSVTNKEDGCNLDNWVENESTAGLSFIIEQSGASLMGTIGGVTGAFVNLYLGSNTFSGFVDGNELEMTLFGTKEVELHGCMVTVDANITGQVIGDSIQGSLLYTTDTVAAGADCAAVDGCQARQLFSGTRPPR